VTLASEVEGSALKGPDGSVLGTLLKMLFHPSGEPTVVGAQVRPPAALVVVAMPETYLPLSALTFSRSGVSTDLPKLPKARASAAQLGYDPDLTVIWSDMPIAGPSGAPFGSVADIEFDPVSGVVLGLVANEGAMANAAYGRLDVPVDAIVGYDCGAVKVSVEAPALEAAGGLAKAAAATVVGASQAVSAAGEVVGDAVVHAGEAAGRAIKAVKDSKVAEKAARSVGTTWRDSVKAFKDGMKGDE
jgi:hypothetical protein